MGTDSGNKPDATGVRSKAYWWEMLGLLIVLAGGVLLIGTLVTAIKIKSGWMAEESINSAKNRKIEKVSVVVRELTPETVVDRIRLPGMVRPWIEVKVPAEVSGQVLEKPVDKGALVKKAQVLLRIDPKDYRIALDRARSTLNLARQNFARTEKLLKQGVRTPSDRDNDYNALKQAETEVEAAELALARCTITSPSDGVVDDILPEIGEFLNVGAHVATVLDCGRVKVIIGIPEIDIDAVLSDLKMPAEGSGGSIENVKRLDSGDLDFAIAFASGIKLARPELEVIVITGDGDLAAIGGNHFIHACRRNIGLKVVCFNNSIYGMTSGQYSPMTPYHALATTAPYGHIERPFDLCALAVGCGATYVARGATYNPAKLTDYIGEGLGHKGFAFIEAVSQCPTYFGRRNRMGQGPDLLRWQREHAVPVSRAESLSPEEMAGKFTVGVFRDEHDLEYTEEYDRILALAAKRPGGGPT